MSADTSKAGPPETVFVVICHWQGDGRPWPYDVRETEEEARRYGDDRGMRDVQPYILASVAEARIRELEETKGAICRLLADNGCNCGCGHHWDEHESGCKRCLACRIEMALQGGKALAEARIK